MELACLIVRGEAGEASSSKYPAVVCRAAGRPFGRAREAILLPGFVHVRIKSIARVSDGRYLVRLKGVARKRLFPGAILVGGGQAVYRSSGGYGIAPRSIPAGAYAVRGGLFREHELAKSLQVSSVRGGYLLRSTTDLPLVPGARYRLLPPAGSEPAGRRLPFELLMCLPTETPDRDRKLIGPVLEQLQRELSVTRIMAANLRLDGWVVIPRTADRNAIVGAAASFDLPDHPAIDPDAVDELPGIAGDRLLVSRATLSRLAGRFEKEIRRATRAKPAQIAVRMAAPPDLVEALSAELERTGRVARDHGDIVPVGAAAGLSPMEKGVLELLRRELESSGFARAAKGKDGEILEKLVRLRLAVRVGERYCAADSYHNLAQRLLAGRRPGEAISVTEARKILGLPREQVISFLESLDEEGALRRDEQVHRVVRGLARGVE